MNNEVPSYFMGGMMGGALSQLFNRSRPKIQEAIANGAVASPQAAAKMNVPMPFGGSVSMPMPMPKPEAGGMICPDPSAHAQPAPASNPMEEPDAPPQSQEEAAIIDQTAEQIKDDIATGSMGGGFQKVFNQILSQGPQGGFPASPAGASFPAMFGGSAMSSLYRSPMPKRTGMFGRGLSGLFRRMF